MALFRTAALTALLLLVQPTNAFLPVHNMNVGLSKRTDAGVTRIHMGSNDDNKDPTKSLLAGFANIVGNALTKSPLNEGKKALVKSLAGPYDQAAIRAQLDGLIANKPVLMLSFRT